MQLTITARHFELTKAIRDHVEKEIDKLDKYFDHIINVHLTLSIENNRNLVEMSLHASHFNLQSESEELDMYLALDTAIDHMETQIKKLKDKVTNHQKKSLKKDAYYVYANLVERNKTAARRKMVRTKRIVAEALSVDEAMNHFEDHAEPYFIFRNIESDRINVLVKKDETHFKLLEP
ncbi:MAG: ribosome-associated translation inhibitor RaiA [Candidatus Cloacimonetes bacterium]|nr:ribosome-associated translation inhibitor RaiA [Candidatus Cloacimonadota bacterium]